MVRFGCFSTVSTPRTCVRGWTAQSDFWSCALTHVLIANCPDVPGISAAVTGFIAENGGFILDSQQHGDEATGQFFLRVAFRAVESAELDPDELAGGFNPVAS